MSVRGVWEEGEGSRLSRCPCREMTNAKRQAVQSREKLFKFIAPYLLSLLEGGVEREE